MFNMKRMASGMLALSLILTSMFTTMPMKVQAAAPTITLSNTAVSVYNGETASITLTVQNYTKSDFDVDYTMSNPGVVSITKANKDNASHTLTLEISTISTGATGVVVYLTNNLSSYATFTVACKNKPVVEKKDEDKDKDKNEETKDEIDGYKIRYEKYVYGDHGEKAKVKYVDIAEVDDQKMVTAYVVVRDEGDDDDDAYFKANFYDKNNKIISTKYIYEPNLIKDNYYFLWWEIPNNTKKIKFEK